MTTKKTAPQDAMEILHAMLAATLAETLRGRTKTIPAKYDGEGHVLEEEREEVIAPTAAEMAVAAKFLKDNSIFSTPEQDNKMKEMREALAQRQQSRKPTAQDKADALATLGRDLLQ